MAGERIGFLEAISEPLLFQKAFATLSGPQQMVLKAIYGLDLGEEELIWWSAFNGFGRFDALGFLTGLEGTFPYEPREYEDITLILGRRSGKSERISSFIVAYEALVGGHRAALQNKKQDPVFLQVAQDLDTAKANLRQFITHWLEMSPVGMRELKKGSSTASVIRMSTGLITVGPPTIKLRSQAIAVCAMDELAVWPKDQASANPDVEVEIAVRPAMAQFPFRKLIKTSTPWSEEGLLWNAAQQGTQGYLLQHDERRSASDRVLVLNAPTASMQNPVVPRSYLVQEQSKNANAFLREYLAKFAKSVTGFLSPALLRQSVTPRVRQRAPEAGIVYVATMDPAFRQDAFAFCIGHLRNGHFVLDYLDAPRGTRDMPLSPAIRMATIANICREYRVGLVTTDQYHDVSLLELAQQYHLALDPCYLTGKIKQQMWGDFLSILNQGKLRLLDDPELLEELLGMEQHLSPMGTMQISGRRDDRATVVALCVHKALQFGEKTTVTAKSDVPWSTQLRKSVQQGGSRSQWWTK
jgi:hypothetical protein